MIIYLGIKYESNTQINLFLKKILEGKHLLKVKKGHNSHNNKLILPYLELDLYFMIIYLCVKFEFNTQMFSKDIKLNYFSTLKKGCNTKYNWWILP